MDRYIIEMNYNVGFSTEVEADSYDEAVQTAKKQVQKDVHILDSENVNMGDLVFEQVTYITIKK